MNWGLLLRGAILCTRGTSLFHGRRRAECVAMISKRERSASGAWWQFAAVLRVLLPLIALLPLSGATTLSEQIESDYTCYDPAGVSCTCGTVADPNPTISLPQLGLTGTIPAELSACTDLTTVNFYENSLTGTIPAELSAMTSMTYATFNSNSLTGTIPAELSALSLSTLTLHDNSLTGSAPSYLCDAAPASCYLTYSDTDTNQFWCTSVCATPTCELTTERCVSESSSSTSTSSSSTSTSHVLSYDQGQCQPCNVDDDCRTSADGTGRRCVNYVATKSKCCSKQRTKRGGRSFEL